MSLQYDCNDLVLQIHYNVTVMSENHNENHCSVTAMSGKHHYNETAIESNYHYIVTVIIKERHYIDCHYNVTTI